MAEVVTAVLVKQLGQVLKEILAPPVVDKVKRLISVRDDVVQIKDDLEAMQAVLKDADQQPSSRDEVRVWVKQLRDVAYDTEDLLDKLSFRLGEYRSASMLSFLFNIVTWDDIANEIKDIRRRINDMSMRRNNFSLASTGTGASSSSAGPGFAEKSEIVGIEVPMAELNTRLLHGKPRREVIAVHGMSGVGKTTLVRQMYEDSAVKNHFKYRAWIRVTYPFKLTELLISMMRQFNRAREEPRRLSTQEASSMTYDELVEELRDMLEEERYVAFIDNIDTSETWSEIKYALPENDLKSRIVVTTKSGETAALCAQRPENVFPLNPLSNPYAWELFCKNAFPSDDDDGCPDDLKPTANNILRKCGGLPAAIMNIGKLLSTKNKNRLEWESVYMRLGPGLEGRDLQSVLKVLSLGYDDLPFDLKPCFLYFGIYPSSHEIKRTELIRQWVAEGFIDPVHDNLEDLSYHNLKQLTERNLVHVSKEDCFERVETCQVHELDRELILLKSQGQGFHTSMGLQGQARRLAVYTGQNFEGDIDSLSKFRSLFLFGPNSVPSSFEKFRSLKVLSLHRIELDSFPSSIVDLFHLRYLCLRGTKIAKIPESIKKLKNLQTLDLKNTQVSKLPKQIIELEDLRHLLVSDASPSRLRGAKLPAKLGKLKSMQKLHLLDVVKGGQQLKELGKLTQLKKLSISSVRTKDGKALADSIKKMSHIQSLSVSSVGSNELLDIGSLSTPPNDLRSIKLTGRLANMPAGLLSLSLVKLQLSHSQLSEDPFQSLKSLPCLADLQLFDEAYAGEKLEFGPYGFQKLKTLFMGNFTKLKTIIVNEDVMRKLEFFQVLGCNGIISFTGIKHLCNLKEIRLPQGLQTIISREEIQHIQTVSWGMV